MYIRRLIYIYIYTHVLGHFSHLKVVRSRLLSLGCPWGSKLFLFFIYVSLFCLCIFASFSLYVFLFCSFLFMFFFWFLFKYTPLTRHLLTWSVSWTKHFFNETVLFTRGGDEYDMIHIMLYHIIPELYYSMVEYSIFYYMVLFYYIVYLSIYLSLSLYIYI